MKRQFHAGAAAIVTVFGLSPTPSLAQTVDINSGSGFTALRGSIVQQAGADNVAGIAESKTATPIQIGQTGFFNRAAVVQIYGTNSANVTQSGPYGRTELIQIGVNNTLSISQNGAHATNTLIQSGASPAATYSPSQLRTLVSNLLFAPDSAATLPSLGQQSGAGFASTLLAHLDLPRGSACADGLPSLASPPDGITPQDCSLTVFADLGYGHDRQLAQTGVSGFRSDAATATAGATFRLTPELAVGPAFNYTRESGSLDQQLGVNAVDAYQLGAFAAFDRPDMFVHGVFAYGFDHYDVQRSAVGTPSKAHPSGDTLVATVKAGYLVDFDGVQAGPVGGIAYSSVAVNAFAETGNALFTQTVGHQGYDSTQGGAGGRLRTSGLFGCLDAYLDLTAESDLRVKTLRTVSTAFSFAPNQALLTPVVVKPQTYGRVAGGFALQLLPGSRVGLTGSTTFARKSGDSYSVQADFRTQF